MEKIFFICALFAATKFILSIFLICNKLKEISYITEVALSVIIMFIVYNTTSNHFLALLIAETEYLLNKVLVFITIILIKSTSFRLLISITHNSFLGKFLCCLFNKKKLCKKLKYLQEIDYGIRLKHGLPAMAKKTHKKTRVKFDRNGFPKFKSYYTVILPFWDYKKSRDVHFYKANKILYKKALKSQKIRKLFTKAEIEELKNGDTPDKYTWHHHQNYGKLQLVSRKTHSSVSHIGGYSIWGEN